MQKKTTLIQKENNSKCLHLYKATASVPIMKSINNHSLSNVRLGYRNSCSRQFLEKISFMRQFCLLLLFVPMLGYSQTVTLSTIGVVNSKTYGPQGTDVYCTGNTMTFSASVTGSSGFCSSPAVSFALAWTVTDGLGSTIQTGSGASITLNTYSSPFTAFTGTVTCVATASGKATGSCSGSTVTATDSKNKSFTYTKDLRPTSYLTAFPTTICLGNTVNITASGDWSFGNITISGNGIATPLPGFWNINAVPTSSGTKTYTATGQTINTCPFTQTVNVTVNPSPTVSISSSKNPSCINETIQLTASGANTYSWSSGANGNLASTTGSVVNASPSAGGTIVYTVTGTNTFGCTNTVNHNQAVVDPPVPDFTSSITQRTVTLINTTPSYSGSGTVDYIWNYGDGSPEYTTSSTSSHTHTYTSAQTFIVVLKTRVTPSNCQKSVSKNIIIDATPIPNFTMPSQACLKDDGTNGTLTTITFANTSTSNPAGNQSTFVYDWDFGDGQTQTGATYSATITHVYQAVGTYLVKLTATNSTGRETAFTTKYITINPHVIMNGTTDYLVTTGHCKDRSIEFKMGTFTSVTNSTLPIRYWMDYDGNNTNGTNGFDANNYADNTTGFSPLQAPFYYTHTSAGTITIKGMFEIVATGCKTTYTESFTIDPTPTTTIQFSPGAGMCQNTSSPATISSSTTGSAYDWEYIPPSLAVWRPSTQSFNPTGLMIEVGTAAINLKVQNSSGCWSDVVSDVFNVWAAPAPNFTNTTVCNINDAATSFTNTTTGPQTTYLWDFNDASSTSTSASPTHDFTSAGSYNVKLTVTEGTHSCSAEVTKAVTVKPNPTVDFSFSSIQCEQQAITFTDISTLSGNTISSRTWDWDDVTSDDVTSLSTQDHTYTPTFGGGTSVSYNCSLKSTASNGCYDVKIRTVTINKKPAQPTLSVPANGQGHTSNICLGETYTLNASPSSGYAFSWYFNGNSMGAYTNNYYSSTGVGPLPDTRPYTVRITDGSGCYNTSATSTINVKRVNTSLAYTAGYTTLCAGSTVTLTGFVPTPAQSYQWKRDPAFGSSFTNVGTNSKTHLVNTSATGRYQYDGTINFTGGSCTETSTFIDVTNAPVLTLNYTGTNNINTISPQVLGYVSNPFPTYTSFQWYRNDIPYSTLSGFMVTKPGKYYLVATGSCGMEKSAVVEFVYPCNAVGYNSTYTGGQIFNTTTTMTSSGPVILNGDWEITGGATLNLSNLVIVAGNCAKIKVTNGTLNITNTQIVGCGEWNGIIVTGAANTVNISGSIISEAVVGVTSVNGGVINASSNEFDNNNIHIGFSTHGVTNASSILQNTFSSLRLTAPGCTVPHPEYPGWSFVNHPMVYFEAINGPLLFSNKFICMNTNNANIIEGIQAKNCTSVTISSNSDEGFLDKGINIREGNLMTVYNNTFLFRLTPPLDLLTTRSAWFNTGILLKDVKASTIERNLVTSADEGMAYYQNTLVPVTVTNIIKNRMENCTYGLVSAVTENPALRSTAQPSQTIYLQVNCNSFNYNDYGWIGTGAYSASQGSNTVPAGNSFNSNLYWNVCVNDNPRTYYYENITAQNPYALSNPNLVLDGVTLTNANKGTTCFTQGPTGFPTACSNKRSQDQATGIEVIGDQVKEMHVTSYPNPFSKSIEVKVNGIEFQKSFTVRIYDMTGKTMIEKTMELGDNETYIINTEILVPGIYVIQVTSDSGIVYHQKLVKSEI